VGFCCSGSSDFGPWSSFRPRIAKMGQEMVIQ
jgi:hypothetical protein